MTPIQKAVVEACEGALLTFKQDEILGSFAQDSPWIRISIAQKVIWTAMEWAEQREISALPSHL